MMDYLVVARLALYAVEFFIIKRLSIKNKKSYEVKCHNTRVKAFGAWIFNVLLNAILFWGVYEYLLGYIVCDTLYIFFSLILTLNDLKKIHETEVMLDRDLSRIDIAEFRPSMRINLDSISNHTSAPEESTSDFDPNDDTIVYVSSRSEGRKYHAKDDCITHCKPITRGEARSKGLRPCKLCNSGDNFMPEE